MCIFLKTFETSIWNGKQNSLTGPVITGSFQKRAQLRERACTHHSCVPVLMDRVSVQKHTTTNFSNIHVNLNSLVILKHVGRHPFLRVHLTVVDVCTLASRVLSF